MTQPPASRRGFPRSVDSVVAAVIVLAVVPLLLWSGTVTRHSIADASAYQQRIRQAQIARARLFALQIDAETGLRGFTSTGDRRFLEPYADAERAFAAAGDAAHAAALAAGVDPRPVDRMRAEHLRWAATVAAPLLRDPHARGATAIQLAGKRIVDRIRDDDDAMRAELDAAAERGTAELDRALRRVTQETVVACVAVVALAVVLGLARRRAADRIAEERARYRNEKRIADALVDAFVLRALPISPHVGLHAAYVPAEDSTRVGGDWYDAFELPDGRLLFSIGDVAGHGIEAAIVMSRARQAILVAALHEDDPAAVLAGANKAIVLQDGPMVTAICGYVDGASMEVVYATAGHPAPIMAHPNAPATVLPADGIVLGVDPAATYRTFVARAANDAMMVLYTDGVIEHERDLFRGERTLIGAVEAAVGAANPALAIQEAIFRASPPRDDVAILTLSFRALGDGRARTTVTGTQANQLDVPPAGLDARRTPPSADGADAPQRRTQARAPGGVTRARSRPPSCSRR